VPADDAAALAITPYGKGFVSMLGSGNVRGAQYHPEKSHAFGMTILKNFSEL
jgi:glutamine amidotransferase